MNWQWQCLWDSYADRVELLRALQVLAGTDTGLSQLPASDIALAQLYHARSVY